MHFVFASRGISNYAYLDMLLSMAFEAVYFKLFGSAATFLDL